MSEYIEREALIDYLGKRMEKYPVFLGVVCPRIADFPAADVVAVKHGRWIEHEWAEESEGLLISNFECSQCQTWERKKSDYCPNCGAKMGGE